MECVLVVSSSPFFLFGGIKCKCEILCIVSVYHSSVSRKQFIHMTHIYTAHYEWMADGIYTIYTFAKHSNKINAPFGWDMCVSDIQK